MIINKVFIVIIIIYIYFSLIIAVNNCEEINIKSNIFKRSFNVLGDNYYNYALSDIQLNQDIYLYDYISCPNYVCPSYINSTIDCSCDYTDINECPKVLDPQCNKTCSNDESNYQCSGGSNGWIVIDQLDKEFKYTIDKKTQFRLKANGTQCSGIHLKVNSIDGYGYSQIGSSLGYAYSRSNSLDDAYQKNMQYNICPTDNVEIDSLERYSWTTDTYYIEFTPVDGNFTFSFILRSIEIKEKGDTSIQQCQELLSTHKCLTVNEHYLDYVDLKAKFYTLQITKPDYYYFNIPNIGLLSITAQIYISTDDNNKYPYIGNSTYELLNERDYKMMLYLEPINSTHPLTVYFRVAPVSPFRLLISINNYGRKYQYTLSSLPSAQSGYLELKSSSKLVLKNQTIYYSPKQSLLVPDSSKFSILYPQLDVNPLYPIPIYFDYNYKIRNMVPEYNSFKPQSYQFSFLLDQNSNSIYQQYQSFEVIKNSNLIINRDLFNQDGKPIKLNISFIGTELKLVCDKEKYNGISQFLDSLISSLIKTFDENSTNSYRYSIDMLLSSSDGWLGCKNKIDQLFNTGTVEEMKLISSCQYDINDGPLYSENPCCNKTYSFYECCNPTLTLVNSTKNLEFNLELIKNQCSSLDCTMSVLSEYNKTQASIDECSVKDFDLDTIGYNIAKVMRECKDLTLVAPICSSDSDCLNYGSKKCNLFKRVCDQGEFQILDKQYIKCVLGGLQISTLFYLINGTKFNDTTIETLYQQHLIQDCIGSKSIMDRSTYTYLINHNINFPVVYGCLDSTCPLINSAYYDGLTGFELIFDSRLDQDSNCTVSGYCPTIDCENTQDCKDECNSKSSFCGYCSSDKCYSLDSSVDQSTCQSQNLCLLPNGQYLTNVSEEECIENYGKCTENCGQKCSTIYGDVNGCFIPISLATVENCKALNENFKPVPSMNFCYTTIYSNLEECQANQGYKWQECGDKPVGDCIGDAGVKEFCSIKDIECTTKQQCINDGGSCSDQYYFSNKTRYSNYPSGLGNCLRKHNFIGIDGKPACNYLAEADSPLGCFFSIVNYNTRAECDAAGLKWWVQAKSKEECLSYFGCKTLQANTLPYNFRYNEMDKEECLSCNESYNEWVNAFEWKSGQWLPGIYIKAEWITTSSYISNQLSDTFSYELFYSTIKRALASQKSESYRTETLCKLERIRNSLNSLVCSCDGSGDGSSCFESSIPVIGITKVCPLLNSTFTFEIGKLEFSNESITQTCQTFTISQITKEIYTSTVPDSLASNFVAYNKPPNYGITNDNGATIGVILSDGIIINTQSGVRDVLICFKESSLNNGGKLNDKYPVFGLAVQLDSESHPTPLNLISQKQLEYYCTHVSNVPSGSPIYFQINQLQDGWEDNKKEVFDQDTKGLLYTLGVIFLLVSLFGFYQIAIIIYLFIKKVILHFQLIQILTITITLFTTIRTIYFFLLVDGNLSNNPVLDYILVVLPTFLYFTSFSLVLAIWYAIVYLVLKNNRSSNSLKRLYIIVFLINLLLYIFFIAIIFVYQYTKFIPNNDCGSRIFTPLHTSVPQKAVSIAYAVVQSVLSLAIGISFVYLGTSLYKTLSFKKIKTVSNSNHQQKIFIISITSSLGFILHCIFVLVLVSNLNSIVFSFIGLIVTEVLPAVSILYCFNPKLNDKVIKSKEKQKNSNKLSATKTQSLDE